VWMGLETVEILLTCLLAVYLGLDPIADSWQQRIVSLAGIAVECQVDREL